MADIFLIVVISVAFAILLVGGIYFLIYYQHPDDRNDSFFPKLIVLGSFMLAGTTILGLPLDVANAGEYPGMFCMKRAVSFSRFQQNVEGLRNEQPRGGARGNRATGARLLCKLQMLTNSYFHGSLFQVVLDTILDYAGVSIWNYSGIYFSF
jgi:hypothetical protein